MSLCRLLEASRKWYSHPAQRERPLDHGPAHFHVRYGDQRAIVAIDNLAVIEGNLSPRARGLIVEWAALHRDELREAWNLALQHAPLKPVAPLE